MNTKHNHQSVFGRRVAGCPRCAELSAGAPPIRWRCDGPTLRARDIRAHDCKHSRCGLVCTFGDW